jgi:thioester reductase-like protein
MRGQPDAILFTGFPGFIGERLLPRLLAARRDAAAVCVVQARFAAAAVASRAAIEARHPGCAGRIELVDGDITRERVGLADPGPIAARIVEAWHLAALYDLAVTRESGMAVNVQGTRNVLQLLGSARGLRRLHHVSTAYVSGDATGTFRETDLDVGQGFNNHYEETKFLAEIDVAGSGLPVTIHRPAIVVGDSRTGETGKFDGPYFTLSAMERIPSPGLFVTVGRGRNPANLVPVDFVVDALVALSGLPGAAGKTYHLTDPAPLPALEVGRLLARELGKRFAFVPVPLRVARAAFGPPAVQRWLGMPVEALDYFDHDCRYDTTLASADLAPLGVACPPFASYVEPMVAFYRTHRGGVRRAAMV